MLQKMGVTFLMDCRIVSNVFKKRNAKLSEYYNNDTREHASTHTHAQSKWHVKI